jgi:hypothetical protein
MTQYRHRHLESRHPSMNASKLLLCSTLLCLLLTQLVQISTGEADLIAVSAIEKCTQTSSATASTNVRSCAKKLKLVVNVNVSNRSLQHTSVLNGILWPDPITSCALRRPCCCAGDAYRRSYARLQAACPHHAASAARCMLPDMLLKHKEMYVLTQRGVLAGHAEQPGRCHQ